MFDTFGDDNDDDDMKMSTLCHRVQDFLSIVPAERSARSTFRCSRRVYVAMAPRLL
jgi:hypothetical protein